MADDFALAGSLIRPAALAMIRAHLDSGHDVVVPQLIANAEELKRLESTARDVGADFVELVLMADRDSAVARFPGRVKSRPGEIQPVLDRIASHLGSESA